MTDTQIEWACALSQEMTLRYFLMADKGCSIENSEALDIPEMEIIRTLKVLDTDINELAKFLDVEIAAKDWTNCLGHYGSGNRERKLAIEGLLEVWHESV